MRISLVNNTTSINESTNIIHVELDRNDLAKLLIGEDINIIAYENVKTNPEDVSHKILYKFNLASR